ncbi:helix-turn-helix domain-containing protein [Nocardiopsis sp. MG754419]|uniref:helix-turn-helix domain-containing protein n=1 Tax=Nocardiopsis sp. MG754419 TaxID=2259865 RepID=UPI0020127073|nr:helix-turn-helix domain-containing protein [Nocardiopsis sp. MG754419]
MATIGQTLSAARIAAGCSLENLSTRTRIRMQVLRAIESEDFVPCGGDFYARGHIRRICKFLGVDPRPLLEEYDREHASSDTPTFIPPPRHPAAKSKAARVAAAQGDQAHSGATDHEAPQEVLHRFGDEGIDPEQRAENWGHFERNKKLARRPRSAGRPRRRGAPAAPVPRPRGDDGAAEGVFDGTAGVEPYAPEPESGEHRRPPNPGVATGGPFAAAAAAAGGATVHEETGRNGATRTEPAATRPAGGVRRHWPWAVVGLILVAAVIVGVRTWNGWDEGNPARTALETVRENDSGDGDAVGSVATPSEGEATDRAGAVAPDAELEEFTVVLTGAGRSWVKVTDPAGEDVFTGFIVEGEALDYVSDQPLTLRFGNAGVVGVAVDGEDLGAGGRVGEVKEITVGAGGIGD